jgi:hypothetical protein
MSLAYIKIRHDRIVRKMKAAFTFRSYDAVTAEKTALHIFHFIERAIFCRRCRWQVSFGFNRRRAPSTHERSKFKVRACACCAALCTACMCTLQNYSLRSFPTLLSDSYTKSFKYCTKEKTGERERVEVVSLRFLQKVVMVVYPLMDCFL